MKKKLGNFLRNFVLLTLSSLIFDCIFRSSDINFFRYIFVALGVCSTIPLFEDKLNKKK